MIAEEDLPSGRLEIARVGSDLLHAAGWYFGFNYVDWLDGGWAKWREEGQPEDNTKYLGDQTKVRYY